MTKNTMVLGAIVIIVVGLITYVLYSQNDAAMMEKDAMQEQNAMKAEDAMMKDDSMKKEGDTMMKDDAMKKEGTAMEGDAMMKKGSYEPYAAEKLARASSGDVVLFFRASWCPTCKSADADIRAHLSGIPSNVTILDVDYDASTELKKKYGVTYQHTFVQVAADGTQIKKWSGSPTLAALLSEVQ